MSTLHHLAPDRHRTKGRRGTALALTALIAIGLTLVVLAPTTAHRAPRHRPNTAATIHTHPISAAIVTRPPAGCLRDPQTHALYCSGSAPAPFGIPTPPGYLRDPATPELMRVANPPGPAEQLPVNHTRGRIIP